MIIILSIMVVFVVILSYVWAKGIDNMKENHPDYKGEEFLNWDRENDDWDKTHTEDVI
jgi:hypothetical protein